MPMQYIDVEDRYKSKEIHFGNKRETRSCSFWLHMTRVNDNRVGVARCAVRLATRVVSRCGNGLLAPVAIATLLVLALTRPAAAQAEPDPAAAPPPAEDAAPATRYARSVIDRPLTLPKGLAMLGADLLGNHDFSVVGLAPIVGYGFTDDIELQVSYLFTLDPGEAKGPLAGDVGIKLLRGALGGKFELLARARGIYDSLSEFGFLQLGLHAQYNATPKLAFISGIPGTEHLRITLTSPSVNGVDLPKPVDFSMPFGIGFQATPELYFQLDTKLFQIDISDSANGVIGDDFTPLTLTAVYNAIPALDVQAAIGLDASADEVGDSMTFLLGFRYYAGKL